MGHPEVLAGLSGGSLRTWGGVSLWLWLDEDEDGWRWRWPAQTPPDTDRQRDVNRWCFSTHKQKLADGWASGQQQGAPPHTHTPERQGRGRGARTPQSWWRTKTCDGVGGWSCRIHRIQAWTRDLPRIWCWIRRWNTWCSSSLHEPWNASLTSSGLCWTLRDSWSCGVWRTGCGSTFWCFCSTNAPSAASAAADEAHPVFQRGGKGAEEPPVRLSPAQSGTIPVRSRHGSPETDPQKSTRSQPMLFYLTHNLDMAVIGATGLGANESVRWAQEAGLPPAERVTALTWPWNTVNMPWSRSVSFTHQSGGRTPSDPLSIQQTKETLWDAERSHDNSSERLKHSLLKVILSVSFHNHFLFLFISKCDGDICDLC